MLCRSGYSCWCFCKSQKPLANSLIPFLWNRLILLQKRDHVVCWSERSPGNLNGPTLNIIAEQLTHSVTWVTSLNLTGLAVHPAGKCVRRETGLKILCGAADWPDHRVQCETAVLTNSAVPCNWQR